MITASPKSGRLRVKSSPSRARRTSSGCNAHRRDLPGPRGHHQRLPPVPGRLTRQHHPGETRLRRHRPGPGQDLADSPRRPPEHPPGQHHRVMITNHRSLPLRGQIHRHDRPVLARHLTQGPQLHIPAHYSPASRTPTLAHDILLGLGLGNGKPHSAEGDAATSTALPGVIRRTGRCRYPLTWRADRSPCNVSYIYL